MLLWFVNHTNDYNCECQLLIRWFVFSSSSLLRGFLAVFNMKYFIPVHWEAATLLICDSQEAGLYIFVGGPLVCERVNKGMHVCIPYMCCCSSHWIPTMMADGARAREGVGGRVDINWVTTLPQSLRSFIISPSLSLSPLLSLPLPALPTTFEHELMRLRSPVAINGF